MEKRPGVQQPPVIKEEDTAVECSSSLSLAGKEARLIKEETQEEAIDDVKVKEEAARLDLTPVGVKSEEEEAASGSAPHMKREADGGHGGGPQPASSSFPDGSLSSESDTDDSDDWSETSKVELSGARGRNIPGSLVKPSGAGGSSREYKYAGLLDFLIPFLRPSRSSQTLSRLAYEEDPESESPTAATPPRGYAPDPSASSVRRRPSRSRSPRDRPRRGASRSAERRSQETAAKPRLPESKLEECYHFALSLVPLLKALDDDGREAAKIRIINLLHGIHRRQRQCQKPPPATSCPQ